MSWDAIQIIADKKVGNRSMLFIVLRARRAAIALYEVAASSECRAS